MRGTDRLLQWQRDSLSLSRRDVTGMVHRYCRFLRENDVGLFRATLALSTLHPQIQALRYVWFDDARDPGPFPSPALFMRKVHHLDGCTVDEAMMSYGARDTAQYRRSPFSMLGDETPRVDFRLQHGAQHAFPVLDDLAPQGASHYAAFMLPGTGGEGSISLVTRAPGGFAEDELAFIEASLTVLSLLIENALKDLILDTILDCYVGSAPGREIRRGNIRPGVMLGLSGAIWFSDIRGYSTVTQQTESG